MFEFKKKETLIQNIAFMSLMGAINLIITLLMTFIPFVIAFSLIFLPLTSVLVTIYCKKKYFVLYFLATLSLCLLITLYNITDTLFFILPSMISGFLFGLMVEYKFPSLLLIIIPSFVTLVFTYLSVPFIQLIYGINFIDTILKTFALDTFTHKDIIVPSMVFIFALIQSLFSYMVIKEELFKVSFEETKLYKLINLLINILCIILIISFSFIYTAISYIFLIISLFITNYLFINQMLEKNKVFMILNLSSLIVTFFFFSILYQYIGSTKALLLVTIFPALTSVYYGVNIYLQYRKNKSTINKEAKQ